MEISSFDLRYESYRLKSPGAEKALLVSILAKGFRDPLQGVDAKDDHRILLNGFKRYRCAKKLGIGIVPYSSLGSDEAFGIVELIRIANAKSLNILEQAKLIDGLNSVHEMSVSEIANLLEKSKSWVSMRLGIIGQMTECVRNKVFSGKFPTYSYMYTLRKFIRMNSIRKEEVDEFVRSVAGKNLSIRDIEILAHGYFKGPTEFREQIKRGNVSWGLNRLKGPHEKTPDCTKLELEMLRDLEILQKYMQRVIAKSKDRRFENSAFFAQANLLVGEIIRQIDMFAKTMEEFYDQTGQANSDLLSS